MMKSLLRCFFLLGFASFVHPSFGQTAATATATVMPANPADILKLAADQNGLTSPDLKPWYLKATYSTFDEQGQPKDTGVFEEWWASPTKYKRRYSSKSFNLTEYVTDTGIYRVGAKHVPFAESLLPERMLAPVPAFSGHEWDKLFQQKQNDGGTALDCVVLQREMMGLISAPIGLFPTYCFSPAKPVLRWSGSYGQYNALYNQLVTFQGKHIAEELTIMGEPNLRVLTAHVETLAGLTTVNDADFQPPGEATAADREPIEISPKDSEVHIVKKVPPMYPTTAKQANVEGKVVIQTIIGEDGHVHQMTVLQAPHPLLAIAAMMAVKQWQYEPYLLNGQPVRVQTQINVIFRLR